MVNINICEQFVLFETAKMLKEAGFKANCAFILDDNQERLYRPTQALAERWLREVHGMHIEIYHRVTGYGYFITKIETNELLAIPTRGDETQFDIYEEAFENALRKAIKLIKK